MKTNRLDSVIERQQRAVTLDTIFALIVAFCLLISIVGLSSTTDAAPSFAAGNQDSIVLAECTPIDTISGDYQC